MMDLSNFRILKEDQDSFHIQSPSGHKMSVHKALLSGPAKSMIKKMCAGGEVQKFEGGGEAMPPASIAVEPEQAPAAIAMDPVVAPQPGVVPEVIAAPEEPAVTAQPVAAEPQAPADPMMQKGVGMDQVLSKEQSDIADLSKSQQSESGAQAKAYKDYNDAMARMETPEQVMENYKAKDETLMKAYLKKEIDPDNYIHHMRTGARIRAGIAMALGGMGAGLTGGPNPAMEFFKNAIDRDLEAQKGEQGKSYNLWRMNRDAMGDDMRAKLATQNQLWTGVQAKVAMAAAQAQAPVAKFHAQQMINDIEKQKIQNRMTLGLLTQGAQGGGSFSHADPSQLVGQLVPKELQSKAYEEIGAAQNTAKNAPGIIDAFDRAANEIHGVDFIPGMSNVHQKALHALLGPTFQDVEGTVRQGAINSMNDNVTPQFGDDANTLATKRKTLLGYLHSKSSAPISKGAGIDLSRFASTSTSPLANMSPQDQNIYKWAQAHPSNEKAKMALEKFKGMGIE